MARAVHRRAAPAEGLGVLPAAALGADDRRPHVQDAGRQLRRKESFSRGRTGCSPRPKSSGHTNEVGHSNGFLRIKSASRQRVVELAGDYSPRLRIRGDPPRKNPGASCADAQRVRHFGAVSRQLPHLSCSGRLAAVPRSRPDSHRLLHDPDFSHRARRGDSTTRGCDALAGASTAASIATSESHGGRCLSGSTSRSPASSSTWMLYQMY